MRFKSNSIKDESFAMSDLERLLKINAPIKSYMTKNIEESGVFSNKLTVTTENIDEQAAIDDFNSRETEAYDRSKLSAY